MRLKIDTDGTQFRVAGPVRPKQDYKDKERQGDHAGRRADLDRPPGRDRTRP